jgi:hypothetical protein
MAGIGKTALAAHVAYALRPYFPDGVLWASVDRTDPLSILQAFAGAYQQDVSEYGDIASRSQVVRDILAHKQALIVIDNAVSSDQIRPLLPPSRSCAVIITTRHRDLAITYGSDRLDLEPFDPYEAYELFAAILGEEQSRQQKETLLLIAEMVGFLPLAIKIVATRIAYEPGWSAEMFLERLNNGFNRLDVLADEAHCLHHMFDESYRILAPSIRQFLTDLAATGNHLFDLTTGTEMTNMPLSVTQDYLRQLHRVSLIEFCGEACYKLSPLVREFARDKTRASQLCPK